MRSSTHRRHLHPRAALAGLLLLLGILLPGGARAQEAEPGSGLRVHLLTMGQGDLVWEKFGHNAIWIHDPEAGTDRVYNYGVFDFHSPGYWGRFVRGNWLYELGVADIDQTMWQYRYLNRSVWAQELNLTPAQKAELQGFLEWNARPENREYPYDYYRDNCSTRVRDVLDRVVGGRLREVTEGEPTGTTYRWHSDRLIADDRVAYTGLLAGLGPAADRPIDRWEEMFLPFVVQEQVRRVQVPDESGRLVPLVASEQTLFQAVGRAPERADPPGWLWAYLLAGVGLGGVLAGLGALARRSRVARFAFAAAGGVWALAAGIGGFLLVGLWALTDHTIAHRNENLFQLDPLALGLVVLVPALALGARWAARPARVLALAVAGFALLGLLVQVLPWFDQVNGSLIAFALPAHLGLAWGVDRLAASTLARGARPAPAPPARRRRGALAR